jgi:hypothetical protein
MIDGFFHSIFSVEKYFVLIHEFSLWCPVRRAMPSYDYLQRKMPKRECSTVKSPVVIQTAPEHGNEPSGTVKRPFILARIQPGTYGL